MNFRLLLCATLSLITETVAADAIQPAAPGDTGRVIDIEEATVVASPKETSRLRSQALSVSLLDGATLERRGVTGIKGVSTYAPNFFMPDYGSRITSAVYIRGIGSRINTPAVGLYVDNVPYMDKSTYDFHFLDVERVDVLRGPQGTLYGRNSMGGLMRVYTRNPLDYRGTDVRAGFTTRSSARRAAFTTYLHPAQDFAFSLGGYYEGQDGFFHNQTTGQHADAANAGGGRLRAAFRSGHDLDLDFHLNYDYSDEYACPYFYEGPAKGTEEYAPLLGLISQNRQSRYRRAMLNTGLSVEWRAPRVTLSSVTAYQHLTDRLFMDQDFLADDVFSLTQRQRLHTLSEEIAVKSKAGKRWQWTTGAFLLHQRLRTSCPVDFYGDGIDYLNEQMAHLPMGMELALTDAGLTFDGTFQTPGTNAALYHQSTFRDLLVRGLSATVGLRLDYDYRSLELDAATAAAVNYRFSLAMDGMPMRVNKDFASVPDMAGRLQSDSWQLLPKFALQYDLPARRGNVYVTASKGYRSGGYNIQAYSDLARTRLTGQMMGSVKGYCQPVLEGLVGSPAFGMFSPEQQASIRQGLAVVSALPDEIIPDLTTLDYRPETSWNYEAGTHLNLCDALQADAAVFLMDTRNQQIARFAGSSMGRTVVNAGKSRSYGAELSLRAALADNRLALTATYGYTHATFRHYDMGQNADGESVDYTGHRVPFVPAHTASLAADWTQRFDGTGFVRSLTVGADATGAGRIYWDEANSMSQPFYVLLGAHVDVSLARNVTLSLWSKNLTATLFDTFRFDNMNRRFAQRGIPRHFGIDVRAHF